MIDTIFLVTEKSMIYKTFPIEISEKFIILDMKDVIKKKVETRNVKYIFSTWNFPEFNINEINLYFPSLEKVFYAAGDTSYFKRKLEDLNITIIDAKTINGKSVADFTLGQILLANKGYFLTQQRYKKSRHKLQIKKIQNLANNYSGNYQAKIGLLGFGSIAKQLSEMLRQFEFEVWAYDPYITDEEFAKYGVKKSKINDIFTNCSIVSNHLPDITETKNIIDLNKISMMPLFSTLINTGRGRQINEFDLLRFCLFHKNFTCLLDVTRHEPLFPFHPLYFLNNVFISPHIAGSQSQERYRMGEYVYKEYLKITGESNEQYI